MEKTTRLKSLALWAMFLLCVLLPVTMTAQQGGSDGFFGSKNTADYQNRGTIQLSGSGDFTLGGASQENPTPMGSGLLIMVVAGAGYALLKKKEEAK